MNELEKHIGERISFGHKRPNGGIFFDDGILKAISETHIFVLTSHGEQALLLSDISKIEFAKQGDRRGV